jgi:hypothetical protein
MSNTVLRPELYHRLCDRFGRVLIANEGEAMRAEAVRDPVSNRLQLNVIWPGEYYVLSCPFCNDTRCRLWINHRWALYVPELKSDNLWLAHCYNENCLAVPGRATLLRNQIFDNFVRGKRHDPVRPGRVQPAPRAVKAPGPYIYPLHILEEDHPAVAYLRERGYDTKQLGRELHVGWCLVAYPDFPLANDRIIVPVTFNGALVGWQARYIGQPPDDRIPKFITMPGMPKSRYLYNFDGARNSPFVVLCEGVSDVWAFGPEAVALFGKSMSGEQLRLVTSTWGQGAVVVLLDGDAADEAMGVYDALGAGVRRRVLVQLPPDKDPGDFPRDVLREMVFAAALQQGVDLAAAVAGR